MSAQTRAKRILLLGYYGFGNAGDEAVLAGLIQSLSHEAESRGKSIEIAVLSIAPEKTTRDHGVQAFHRYRIGDLLKALNWCDLLAAGGGSLLQDVTSAHSIFYYLGVVRLAQFLGKKTMFIAQGIGPLNLPRSRRLTASVARRCNAITVRDVASKNLLGDIGVYLGSIEVTADPALLLGESPTAETSAGSEIMVSLRPWQDDDKLSQSLTNAINATSLASLKISPIACYDEDIAPLHAFLAQLSKTSSDEITAQSYQQIISQMPDCKLMIGMRLHALILATACGVPCVALSYDPKVAAFMEQSGQGDAVYDIRSGNTDALLSVIDRVWSNVTLRRDIIAAKLPELKELAQNNAVAALRALDIL